MNVRIHFRHISHSEETEAELQTWLQDYLGPTLTHDFMTVDLFVTTAVPRNDAHSALFECHMTAQTLGQAKKMFARATDYEFWSAVTECGHKFKRQIGKNHDRRVD